MLSRQGSHSRIAHPGGRRRALSRLWIARHSDDQLAVAAVSSDGVSSADSCGSREDAGDIYASRITRPLDAHRRAVRSEARWVRSSELSGVAQGTRRSM